MHNYIHETGLAKLYTPLKVGVLGALVTVVITNIYTVSAEQGVYNDKYDYKFNMQELAGICQSANQMMNCISEADQYGSLYALEDFMEKVSNYLGKMLLLGPAVAAVAGMLLLAAPKIFSFLAAQIKECCVKTPDPMNENGAGTDNDIEAGQAANNPLLRGERLSSSRHSSFSQASNRTESRNQSSLLNTEDPDLLENNRSSSNSLGSNS